jgi:hypothetical protein
MVWLLSFARCARAHLPLVDSSENARFPSDANVRASSRVRVSYVNNGHFRAALPNRRIKQSAAAALAAPQRRRCGGERPPLEAARPHRSRSKRRAPHAAAAPRGGLSTCVCLLR